MYCDVSFKKRIVVICIVYVSLKNEIVVICIVMFLLKTNCCNMYCDVSLKNELL